MTRAFDIGGFGRLMAQKDSGVLVWAQIETGRCGTALLPMRVAGP